MNLSSRKIDENVLFKIGIFPLSVMDNNIHPIYPVLVDGRLIGWADENLIKNLLHIVRILKSQNSNQVNMVNMIWKILII